MVSNYINSNYRITVSGVYLTENALENPNLVQVSVMADTFINVRPSGEAYSAGIRYQENGESPSWRLTGVNTRINNPDAHNIYARLRRDRDGESLITFDMRDRNIDGTVKGDSNSTIDPDFYYIKIGTLSATDSVENPTLKREITFDFGYYKTDSSNEEDSNGWRKLFELTQNGLINALKHFASFVVEGTITLIGRLEFGKDTGKYVNDIHRSFDNKDAEFTDTSVSSSLYIDNTYLNKTKADTAQAIITFAKGFISEDDAKFEKDITVKGLAKTLNLEVEQLATIARCVVDIISSPVFVDGFFGEGFQIWKSLATGDWNMTIDRLTVRKVFTVFELLIQKMRSVGGMLVVSAADGKIETVERVGDDYRITFASGNGFQANDLIRHQIFSGDNVEHYWTEVKSVDGNNVIIPVSEFEGVEPQVGDECVLMGNTKNKLRQSLITISAVEDGQPRIDVLSGVDSKSFEGKLVTRLGNMDGIKDIYFPADNQPHGDGLYGTNCYLRGTFLLVTGEDILTKFLVMENMFRSEMENLRNEIQEKDNYLSNSAFASDTDRWETTNDIRFFTVGGKFLFFNGNFYSNKKQVADIIKLSTRNVLRIKASGIKQTNADLARKPKYNASDTQGNETAPEFFVSFRVRVLDHGVLTIGFPGQGLYHTETLEPTDEFIQKEYSGTWDGTGDFEMKFTGDAYFYSLALTDNAFEEMYTKFSTKIEQTNERIELLATATSEMGDKLQSSIEVTAKDISLVSEKTNKLDNTLTSMGIVIDGDNGNIRQFVKKDGVISSINQTSESVSIDASKINLNGVVTANERFRIFEDGSMEAINGKFFGLFSTQNTIGNRIIIDPEQQMLIMRKGESTDLLTLSFGGSSDVVRGAGILTTRDLQSYTTCKIDGKSFNIEQTMFVDVPSIKIDCRGMAHKINDAKIFELSSEGLFFYDSKGNNLNRYPARGSNLYIVGPDYKIYTLEDDSNCYISCYNTGELLLNLPANPSLGTKIMVKRINAYIKVLGNGNQIYPSSAKDNSELTKRGELQIFVFDGTYWLCNWGTV